MTNSIFNRLPLKHSTLMDMKTRTALIQSLYHEFDCLNDYETNNALTSLITHNAIACIDTLKANEGYLELLDIAFRMYDLEWYEGCGDYHFNLEFSELEEMCDTLGDYDPSTSWEQLYDSVNRFDVAFNNLLSVYDYEHDRVDCRVDIYETLERGIAITATKKNLEWFKDEFCGDYLFNDYVITITDGTTCRSSVQYTDNYERVLNNIKTPYSFKNLDLTVIYLNTQDRVTLKYYDFDTRATYVTIEKIKKGVI